MEGKETLLSTGIQFLGIWFINSEILPPLAVCNMAYWVGDCGYLFVGYLFVDPCVPAVFILIR